MWWLRERGKRINLEVCRILLAMYKSHHPNAYLHGMRNIKSGLKARTKILLALEDGVSTARKISDAAGISYASVLHHLHLLRRNRIVDVSASKAPYAWRVTGLGHGRLSEAKG